MNVDYLISSLPALSFGQPPSITWENFTSLCEEAGIKTENIISNKWCDIEIQLRNALAIARGGEKWTRPAKGCSLYWRNRITQCFQEKNIAKRDELIDRVWWDAADELTDPAQPLSKGALATYALKLKVALKRNKISTDKGNEVFDKLTAETRITFNSNQTT